MMRRESRTPKSLEIGVLAYYSQRISGDTGSARHIGRLGALAVALGIGAAAMALPGIALADDTGAAGSGPDRSTAKTGTSERARGVRGSTGPTAAPAPAASAPAKARGSRAGGTPASAPIPAPRRESSVIPARRAAQPAPAAVTAGPSGNLTAGPQNPAADLSNRRQNNAPSGQSNDLLAGAALLVRRNVVDSVAPPAATVTTAGADPVIRLAVFGDAGNSYTNGTSFYYSPGAYARYDLGASGPLQQAVAEMMRGWNPTDMIQLGDESYNVASSTLLDYNIGQYYNDWIHPYAPPAYTQPGSIYTDGSLGGVQAEPGRTQWPYNLYNFPNGFPNPADPTKPGGSSDGVNHYYAVPGNHDVAGVLGTYNDASVNQVNYNQNYIGEPGGPDAYDYQNNIVKNPPYPKDKQFIPKKIGSNQSLLDYHAYLGAGNPGNLKPGTLNIGKLDPNGYGIYYGLNLGDAGDGRPLIHVTIIDTSRLLTDAGQYKFNFAPNGENTTRDPKTGNQTAKLTKILGYDVRNPDLTAADAWFQDPSVPLDAPSIGREMFLWAKSDLEQSDAVWNIVMGHHPAYHVGTPQDEADKSYSSNAPVLNFLQGLQDDSGATLFDSYMNGHSHAYARVLEMTPSADGIGTGIPFFTIGDGGKMLDALNLAPYGTDVLSPINYANFVGYKDGVPQYNYDINLYGSPDNPNSEAASLAAYQAADPTSVGLSGFYSYSKYNWPEGNGYNKDVNPAKLIITSVTTDGTTGVAKKFELTQPTYLSYLSSQSDLSGLYGYGSGAAQVDAGDKYLMVHYKTAQPVDPAITLIGRGQGVTDFASDSLFYKQWSPTTAKADDLGMFSFDVENGSLTNVQLVNRGNGYFESDVAGGSYLDTTQDFEILGNNPVNPLGFNTSDPSRAVVRLSFSGGQLTGATLINPGSGYEQVAKAILQCNYCTSTVQTDPDPKKNKSLLVGLNIDIEAQYNLAATRPTGSEPYQDWYLMTDTGVAGGNTAAKGPFGAVDLSLQAASQQARQILADTPLTTGYTGKGPQQKITAPQTGRLQLRDSLGELVGSAVVAKEREKTEVTLDRLPAPGALSVVFSGDATSSYQVNFRGITAGDNVNLNLNYGTWSGPLSQQGSQLVLDQSQSVQVVRTDTGSGRVNFGLTDGTASKMLARWTVGARQGALQADELFGTDPATNWESSERRSQGGAGSATVGAGTWRPTAYQNGRELTLVSLQVEGNGALARFAAGATEDPSDDVLATFTLPATGTTATDQSGVLTVRRLSGLADGLALYEADPVTGAVVDSDGRTRLPGQLGYLKAALDNAKQLGLVLKAEDMPGFGETAVRTDLPIQTDRNYGALLLVNGNERKLLSSYSAANPLRSQQSLSLIAPGRGVSFGFEDRRPWQLGSDRDFNDVIVTLTPAVPTLIA